MSTIEKTAVELPGLRRELIETALSSRAKTGETTLVKYFRQLVKQS